MNKFKIAHIVIIIFMLIGLVAYINYDERGQYMVFGGLIISIILQIIEKKSNSKIQESK